MKLTAAVYRTERTILLEEAHSLVAGDLLEPFILDFSRCGGMVPDTDTLTLVLKRSRTGETVLSIPRFSEVPNHRFLRSATLDLSVSAMGDWYAEEAEGPSPSRKCVEGWIEVSDRDGTWVACPIPVVLRDVTPRGDVTGYYTATQVDALLALKQGVLSFDQAPLQGSTNPVTSGGVFSALAQKADVSALASLAANVSALPSKSYVDTQLATKADLSALDGLVSSTDLEGKLALKADLSNLSLYVLASSMAAYLAPYATSSYVQESVSTAVAGLVTQSQLTATVSGLATMEQLEAALAQKADASFVTEALAAKANATDLEAAIANMVTISALENALSEYATSVSVASAISSALSSYATLEALAGLAETVNSKASAADLALKADASALESLAVDVEGKASKEYVDAAVTGLATAESVIALSQEVASGLAAKANSVDVEAGLERKADRETTYTKSEVDALVGQGGGSDGQPGITFLEPAVTSIPLTVGEETLARVVLVSRDGETVKRIIVEGTTEPYAGTHVLDADNSWSSLSTSGGTVLFIPITSSFRFSYDGTSTDIPCTLPQVLGDPMSELADVAPTAGNYDRAVSSGGVYDRVEDRISTRVTNELHLEDLNETRLITAQNATSCAGAVQAVTEITATLLELEQTFAKKTIIEAALALKAGTFYAKSPLILSGGELSIDRDALKDEVALAAKDAVEEIQASITDLQTTDSNHQSVITDLKTADGEIRTEISKLKLSTAAAVKSVVFKADGSISTSASVEAEGRATIDYHSLISYPIVTTLIGSAGVQGPVRIQFGCVNYVMLGANESSSLTIDFSVPSYSGSKARWFIITIDNSYEGYVTIDVTINGTVYYDNTPSNLVLGVDGSGGKTPLGNLLKYNSGGIYDGTLGSDRLKSVLVQEIAPSCFVFRNLLNSY